MNAINVGFGGTYNGRQSPTLATEYEVIEKFTRNVNSINWGFGGLANLNRPQLEAVTTIINNYYTVGVSIEDVRKEISDYMNSLSLRIEKRR